MIAVIYLCQVRVPQFPSLVQNEETWQHVALPSLQSRNHKHWLGQRKYLNIIRPLSIMKSQVMRPFPVMVI